MKTIPFTKMHGLGNCYIYINLFETPLNENIFSKLAIDISKPSTGIGSDGLILIGPSDKGSLKMRIFNKDGSEGKNCGNGLRCVAKYAYDTRLIQSETMTIETLSGLVTATIVAKGDVAQVSVDMGVPKLERGTIPMQGNGGDKVINEPFSIGNHHFGLTAVSMGNPHAVFFVQDSEHQLHKTVGPQIEKDGRFPEGVNVEFVKVLSPQSLHCRVWERGSGVTQACGTGACAVAVAAILNGYSLPDEWITVHLEGGDLSILWASSGNVLMKGPASTTASGVLYWNSVA